MPYLRIKDLDMFYESHGDGEPLFLIHGAFGTHDVHWRSQLPLLSPRFRVVSMDLRGHGKTGNPAEQLSLDMFAEDIVGLIAALDLERVHLFGFSLGGVIALATAVKYPEAVRSLVLWGVNYRPDGKFLDRITKEHALLENPSLTKDLRRLHSHAYGEKQFEDLSKHLKAEATRRRDFTAEELGAVKCATLVCQGDEDEFVALEQAFELRRMIEISQLLVIPGRGHLDLGNAECFNQIVLDFLLQQTNKGPM